MGEMLIKEDTLFERDEKGNLIAEEVVLELLENKPKIKAIPMPRGKVQRILKESKDGDTSKDQDDTVILEHCTEPLYTIEEIKAMKPKFSNAISMAIFSISVGIPQEKLNEATKKSKQVDKIEEEIKKN